MFSYLSFDLLVHLFSNSVVDVPQNSRILVYLIIITWRNSRTRWIVLAFLAPNENIYAEIEKDSELVHHRRISVSCVRGLSHPTIAFLLFLLLPFSWLDQGCIQADLTPERVLRRRHVFHIYCVQPVSHICGFLSHLLFHARF